MRRALLVFLLLALAAPGTAAARDFPKGFLWGTAIAAFQTEAGGRRPTPIGAATGGSGATTARSPRATSAATASSADRDTGACSARTPARPRRLGPNAFRLSIEWSRLFPRSTGGARTPRQLDRLVNQAAARHYAAELRPIRRPRHAADGHAQPLHAAALAPRPDRGPRRASPVSDPTTRRRRQRGGWLDGAPSRSSAGSRAGPAWRYGNLVDLWVTVNEPMVVAVNGYVNVPGAFAGWFPPGVYSFPAAIRAVRNLADANALAYDAVHR